MRDKNVRLQVEQLEDRSVPSSVCSGVNTWDDFAKSAPQVAGLEASTLATTVLPGHEAIFYFGVNFGFTKGCDPIDHTWPPGA